MSQIYRQTCINGHPATVSPDTDRPFRCGDPECEYFDGADDTAHAIEEVATNTPGKWEPRLVQRHQTKYETVVVPPPAHGVDLDKFAKAVVRDYGETLAMLGREDSDRAPEEEQDTILSVCALYGTPHLGTGEQEHFVAGFKASGTYREAKARADALIAQAYERGFKAGQSGGEKDNE